MKKRSVAAASAILGLAFGGGASSTSADPADVNMNTVPGLSSLSDSGTVGASGAAMDQAAAATGNVNTGAVARGSFGAATAPANAGSRLQKDLAPVVRGSTEDPEGTQRALEALTPDQVNATNVTANQQVRSGVGVAANRMSMARMASGHPAYRPGEAIASNRLFGPGGGGGASADAQFGTVAAFATVRYLNLQQDANRFNAGFDQNGWNFLFGADSQLNPNLVVGLMGNYSESNLDYDRNRGKMDADGWGLAAYGTYFMDNGLFIEGLGGFAKNQYDLRRTINYSIFDGNETVMVDQVAKANPDANVFYATLGAGYSIARQSVSFTPQVSLNYTRNAVDGYTESMSSPLDPGGSLALTMDDETYTSFTSRAGFILANALSTEVGVFVPQVSIDWVHEFANDQQQITTRYVNDLSGTRWVTESDEPDRNYFDIGLGVSAQFAQGRSGFVSFNRVVGYDDIDSYTVSGGVRIEF